MGYVPEKLRPFSWENATESEKHEVGKVAPLIKNEMQRLGDALIGFQSVNNRPNFFRIVFASCDIVTEADIDSLMQRMAKIGEEQYEILRRHISPDLATDIGEPPRVEVRA